MNTCPFSTHARSDKSIASHHDVGCHWGCPKLGVNPLSDWTSDGNHLGGQPEANQLVGSSGQHLCLQRLKHGNSSNKAINDKIAPNCDRFLYLRLMVAGFWSWLKSHRVLAIIVSISFGPNAMQAERFSPEITMMQCRDASIQQMQRSHSSRIRCNLH